MFDGNILAEYEEIETDKKIKMKWKFKEWETFGDCLIEFTGVNDSCEVVVKLVNIPSHDSFGNHVHIDTVQRGWKENIFKMIYNIFGYPLNSCE